MYFIYILLIWTIKEIHKIVRKIKIKKEILIMNNWLFSDIYFEEEVRLASSEKGLDFGLTKFGIVVDEAVNGIIIEDGFVKVDVSFAKFLRKTSLISSLPGRHLVETFTIFIYENGLSLKASEFRDMQLEIFRILVGNGIISSRTCKPSSMVKAYKALKRNGVRALLAAAVSGETKRIRAWRCLTCKRLRTDSKGIMMCNGFYHPVPEGLKTTEISALYPDNKTVDGIMMSSYLHKIPKVCMVIKPRVPIRLTKSVVYELDDQISIIQKTMDIDVE